MSELTNLFKQNKSKYETPIKRLFHNSSSSSDNKNTRGVQPKKSIYKHKKPHEKLLIKNENKFLNKRYFNENQLKKQIIFYNNQLTLTLIRNIFFILGGIILFNIIFTKSNQKIIMFNFLLFAVNLQLNFKNYIFGMEIYRIIKQILKLVIYCLNFYIYYEAINQQRTHQPILTRQSYIILINASINYLILALILPLIFLQRLKYHKKPYQTILTSIKIQITRFYVSLTLLLKFIKPILLCNLLFWLTIILFIMYTRDEQLISSLIKLQYILSSLLIYLCLFTFLYIIQEINNRLFPQMMIKNSINIKLINLNPQDKCSIMVKSSIIKYLCRNNEIIWDTLFLSYEINYDLLFDYIQKQFNQINQKIMQIQRKYQQNMVLQRKIIKIIQNVRKQIILPLKQIQYLLCIVNLCYKKLNFLMMIGQIIHFFNNNYPSPVNIEFIRRIWLKIDIQLGRILQQINNKVIGEILKQFHQILKQRYKINQNINV